MYVVTNRKLLAGKQGLDMFGDTPNDAGPNELRFLDVTRAGRGWRIELLGDRLGQATAKDLKQRFSLNINLRETHYASLNVACNVVESARKKKRHVVFFVHGFNNDIGDVLERAHNLERRYNIQVIPFSWPANGGGARGVASYKSDKRDARASVGALDRALGKLLGYLRLLTEANRQELWEKASKKHPENAEKRDEDYARLLDRRCPFTVNCLLHSMGNYLFKQLLKSTTSEGSELIFDNVIMAAADANNLDHTLWVDRIQSRGRVFITINENDHALAAARMKSGQDQLARLGHYPFQLDSRRSVYVNFTDAAYVRSSHAYFEGAAVEKNDGVRQFFEDALNGRAAEKSLRYRESMNYFEPK